MSENDNEREAPRTAWEAEGSPVDRGQHPVDISGAPADRGATASAADVGDTGTTMAVEPEQAAPGLTRRPVRKVGRRTSVAPSQEEAFRTRPTDVEDTHAIPPTTPGSGTEPSMFDPAADRRSERMVTALFTASVLGTIGFVVAFFTVDLHAQEGRNLNFTLAAGLAVSLLGIGAAAIVWAKSLMPHEKAVQERGTHYSHEEDELAAEEIFLKGTAETGFARRKMLRRSMLGALALFPIPFVVALRDLGPLPKTRLRHTGWYKDARLVAMDTRQPIRLGDVPVGGLVTVMPEGYVSADEEALSPTILVRIPPDELRLPKSHQNWAVAGHVAYSKICTHAGCPVGLYEDQTHHLFCPCHQSTFDAAAGCKVIFGPAARPLPQLAIYADANGYLRAQHDYTVPVGPSFWERG